MKILSIDSGSSFMKAYDGEKKIKFPSINYRIDENRCDGKEIRVKGDSWMLGYTAATSMASSVTKPHVDAHFHGSMRQYIQVCYAMQQLGITDKLDVLVCSLPYNDSLNRELKAKIKTNKTFEWEVWSEESDKYETKKVVVKEIKIVAQGVGAMELSRQQKRESERPLDSALLIDVGSCTTDCVAIKRNRHTQSFEYCREACDSIENANVRWFFDRWIDNLKNSVRDIDPNHQFDYYRIMDHAIEGNWTMQYDGRDIDLKPSFERTRRDFTADIFPRIRRQTGSMYKEFHRIIFTGGGTALIDFDAEPDSRISKLDEWANVEGQFKMAQKAAKPKPAPVQQVEETADEVA